MSFVTKDLAEGTADMRYEMYLCRVSDLQLVPTRLAFNRCNYLFTKTPPDWVVSRLRRTQTRIDSASKARLQA